MTPPKFSVGERVVYVGNNPAFKGSVTIITGSYYCTDEPMIRFDGSFVKRTGWVYSTQNSESLTPEESLRPLPPEKKSTWEEVERITGWSPVGVAV